MRAIALRLQRRTPLPLGLIGLVLLLVFFAVLSGAATALAGTLAVFVFGGIVIGAVALVVPLRWMVVGLLVMSFVVVGQITYFGGIGKAAWIPFLIGLVLLVRSPIDMLPRNRTGTTAVEQPQWQTQAMKLCIGLFFVTICASTLINTAPPIQVLVTSKEYVFLWGLYLVLAAGLIKPEFVERVWALLPWLLPLQLPLVAYQRFVVMPRSHALARWDAIVGAFGGNPDGGGASGAMGFFCLIGIFIAIYRYRAGLLQRWHMLLIIVSGILAIGMAEVKFMILLLPFCFVIAFSRDIRRNPVRGILLISLGFLIAFGIFLAYKAQFASQSMTSTKNDYFTSMFSSQMETSYVSVASRNQGRVAAIVFWFKQHVSGDPVNLLVGQGIGSSRVAMTFIGEAQAHHFERLDRSSLSILLWETGLLGTLAYLGMLGSAYLAARSQSLDAQRTAEGRATSQSMAIGIFILAASLPYNTDLLATHQIQLSLLMCLGYTAIRKSAAVLPEANSNNALRLRSYR